MIINNAVGNFDYNFHLFGYFFLLGFVWERLDPATDFTLQVILGFVTVQRPF